MVTRRDILKASVASATVIFYESLHGRDVLAQPGPGVRRSLNGMALDDPDLAAYREFVSVMQSKDQTKPLSWLGYSLQHGNSDTGEFRYCPHGDWYFLPWHRAYVCMYENAVRALTGHRRFAMPYWDWTLDRNVPAPFTDPMYAGKPNPLYVKGRTLDKDHGWPLADAIVGTRVIDRIYRETDFQLFGTSKNPDQDTLDMRWVSEGGGSQGILERTPHNTIHNSIGAFMPSAGSPRDPIFMMHHANIDRIWAYWNARGRSNTSGMDATSRNLWLEMDFANNFLKPDGTPYGIKVKDVQSTDTLGYTYADLPRPDGVVADPERARRLLALFGTGQGLKQVDNLLLLPSPNTVSATPSKPLVAQAQLSDSVRTLVTASPVAGKRSPEVFALIKDMDVGRGVASLRVFVNADKLVATTPDTDPHFVTQISFLQHGHTANHHKAPPSALVDLTDTLRSLSSQGLLRGDKITVQLQPVARAGAAAGPDTRVVPATVEIAVL
jgi:tyrosinase